MIGKTWGLHISHEYTLWKDLMVPSSRSSVKVKYQGHSFLKNGHCGGISVFLKHSLLSCNTSVYSPNEKVWFIYSVIFKWKSYSKKKKTFENVGKWDNAGNQHFLLFPLFIFCFKDKLRFNLSRFKFVICSKFNLDLSIILLFNKG